MSLPEGQRHNEHTSVIVENPHIQTKQGEIRLPAALAPINMLKNCYRRKQYARKHRFYMRTHFENKHTEDVLRNVIHRGVYYCALREPLGLYSKL